MSLIRRHVHAVFTRLVCQHNARAALHALGNDMLKVEGYLLRNGFFILPFQLSPSILGVVWVLNVVSPSAIMRFVRAQRAGLCCPGGAAASWCRTQGVHALRYSQPIHFPGKG